jgi:hypothetical protein
LGQGQSAVFQFCMLGRKSVNYDPDKICKQRRKNIVVGHQWSLKIFWGRSMLNHFKN